MLALTASASAVELPGDSGTINHNGGTNRDGSPQDYEIPLVDPPLWIDITCKGGDGGEARVRRSGTDCTQSGGKGAEVFARFRIGNNAEDLAPGGMLRFIVAGRGEKGNAPNIAGAGASKGGGGGGTAVLYRPDSSAEWIPLIVAGGGGGGFQAMAFGGCIENSSGKSGNTSLSGCGTSGQGNSGGAGGCGGDGGSAGSNTKNDDDYANQGAGAFQGYSSDDGPGQGHPNGGHVCHAGFESDDSAGRL